MAGSYFVCSVGKPNQEYSEENFRRCIDNKCFVLNEWAERKGLIDEIKPGDILLLKHNHHFVAYGKAISSLKNEDISNGEGWSLKIDVNFWLVGNKVPIYGVKEAQSGGTNYDTIRKVDEEFAHKKIEAIGSVL